MQIHRQAESRDSDTSAVTAVSARLPSHGGIARHAVGGAAPRRAGPAESPPRRRTAVPINLPLLPVNARARRRGV